MNVKTHFTLFVTSLSPSSFQSDEDNTRSAAHMADIKLIPSILPFKLIKSMIVIRSDQDILFSFRTKITLQETVLYMGN